MNSRYVLNDLLDVVEKLAEIVADLNPGRTEDHRFIKFLLERADRELNSVFPSKSNT